MGFSFKQRAVGDQSPERTLLILMYELGRLTEMHLKAGLYGTSGANAYYCDANQQKEMADLISMSRYLCELKGWDYEKLKDYGEECYLERMEDLRKYGINTNKS